MPNPIEGLLEVYEDIVEVLLVLEIFLTAIHGHFQCLPLENFEFLYYSFPIGSASSLECNQSDCGVVLHHPHPREPVWPSGKALGW